MVRVRFVETPHGGGSVVQFSHTRTHLGRALYWASSYWVEGVLIDAGPRWTRDRLVSALRARRLDSVWISHHHEDHVGNVAPLEGERGIRSYASSWSARRAKETKTIPPYRRHIWGDPNPGTLNLAPRRFQTPSYSFDVVPIPGHTPGDLAYVEPSRGWAFTGDLFLSPNHVITMPGEDYAATLASLERVAAYEPRVLFTGRRVYDHAIQVLQARIAFLKQVKQDLQALRKEGLTSNQARKQGFGREGWIYYWSRGELSKQHFVDQAYSCIDRAEVDSTNLGTTSLRG